MKRFLIVFLLPILLLTGCAVYNEDDTTTAYVETTPPGLYVSASEIEKASGGAVRLYDLPHEGYRWLTAMGDQLLLASETDPALLLVLTGTDCVPTSMISISPELLTGYEQTLYNGFAYYDDTENQAIYMDPQLQEVNRLVMPEDMIGQPVFSPDGGEIFYCNATEIRAFDVEHKITRLIKSHSYDKLTLLGTYFDGTLISCVAEDEVEGNNTIYVSAQTGQTLRVENGITRLETYGDDYFVQRMNGTVAQSVYGRQGEQAKLISVSEKNTVGALPLGGIVGYNAENGNLELSYYDLTTGKKTAAVKLENVGVPSAFLADRWSSCIWILTTEPELGDTRLLRWDQKLSKVDEEASCFGVLYTAELPDKEGLSACKLRVSSLNKATGVRVRIWQEAVQYTERYDLTPEHQPAAINLALDQLEPILSEFPKALLQKAISSQIRICIVRHVDGEVKNVHYWNGDEFYVVISVGSNVREGFIRALGYVMDSHVLGNSSKYDYWNGLNPEGFAYGSADDKYLADGSRAFVDNQSMMSATDDRSRIFYEAMQANNGELFKNETMQKKLLLLCQAIRDAWDLERKEAVYPWEQYLTESIAYTK